MMHSTVMTITPEQAGVWLERNTKNRKINRATVNRYAATIKAGRWELNAQGIAFFEDGSLADGQHRLAAIVQSGVPTMMMVTFDVPNTSVVWDRGQGRSQANVLAFAGLPVEICNHMTTGAINLLYKLDVGDSKTPDSTVISFAREHTEELAQAARLAVLGAHRPVGKKATVVAALLCAIYCGVPMNTLERFARSVNTGFTDSTEESAAIVVRNCLLSVDAGNSSLPDKRKVFYSTLNGIEDYVMGIPRKKQYRGNESAYWVRFRTNVLHK